MAPVSSNPDAKPALRVAVSLPQDVVGPEFAAGFVQQYARRAERLGFDGLWTQESLRGRAPALEPFVLLAFAAAATQRVELGVAVAITLYRHPIQLARTTASLDQLSGGRLTLGVGLGQNSKAQAEAFGIDPDRPVARFTDGLELLRELWRDERVSHDGPVGRLEGWSLGLKPLRAGGPPIWFGANHPDAIRRAVRLADGWIGAGSSSSEDFLARVPILCEALAETPRDGRSFGIGKRMYLAVGSRQTADRRRLRDWFGQRYGDPDRADRQAIAADPAGIVHEASRLVEAGADLILLNPVFDHRRQLEVLASEVVPALRKIPVGRAAASA
jgi:alkanesulfonate monooxygenase SsuD/methylene tetrahydromethanopterin reductase-like flavin-dependent oxidoreductase (luciferase family)